MIIKKLTITITKMILITRISLATSMAITSYIGHQSASRKCTDNTRHWLELHKVIDCVLNSSEDDKLSYY